MGLIKKLFENKNLFTFILMAAVVILVLLQFKSCGDLKALKSQSKQNEEAMKKELIVEKNKSGFYQTSVVAFEGRIKDVQNYSEELAKEIKDLRNRKPEVIIRTQVIYVGDTATSKNSLTDKGNGNYDLNWDFVNADSSRTLKGKSSFSAKVSIFNDNKTYSLNILPGTTSILQDELKMDFVVGVAKNKKTGFDEIFVTPKNPNVHVGKLEGAIIKKSKPSDFSASVQLGYGIVYGKGNLNFGPYLGVGVSYNLVSGFKKIFKIN
ncbi:MAG TPA: hypothetical protein VMZ91_08515 [Candidatus Paceibacterota bacterium]|nr:hypothetical protein [Candidatus Paceibacterota bacterium]